MTVNDRVYGQIEIENPLIVELINSSPLQRLKKISQDGAPHFIQPRRNVNRFEHSVGVWYLSHRFNRPIEEQVACLLHDVPHTVFSHVVDFIFVNEKHDFHERFTEKLVKESEIPAILKKHGVSLEDVLSEEDFPLLGNDLPDLSFDRLDYFLRDGTMAGFLPEFLPEKLLDDLSVQGEELVFTDQRVAALLAVLFMSFSRLIWLDPTAHGSFFLLAEALKEALDTGIVEFDDLFTTDEVVFEKLQSAKSPKIDALLERLSEGKEFVYVSEAEADFYGSNKPRTVDPLVKTPEGLKRVSDLTISLKYAFEEFKERYAKIGVKQL